MRGMRIHSNGAHAHRSNVAYEPAFQWLLIWTIVAAWISQIVARIGGIQILTLVLLLVAIYVTRLLDETRATQYPSA